MAIKFNILAMIMWIITLVGVYMSGSLVVSTTVLTMAVFLHLLIHLVAVRELRGRENNDRVDELEVKKKVYLAHSISTTGEYNDSKRVAEEIRALGFEVYAAAENDSINDKSNEPTPEDIYEGDINEIMSSDIFVVNLSGGLQDGTISEIGFVAGYNEMNAFDDDFKDFMAGEFGDVTEGIDAIPIIAYTSNARLLQPQFSDGIPSASANHLVKGMIDRWGTFVGNEDNMLKELEELV